MSAHNSDEKNYVMRLVGEAGSGCQRLDQGSTGFTGHLDQGVKANAAPRLTIPLPSTFTWLAVGFFFGFGADRK